MLKPGDYAANLRLLGQLVGARGACDPEIIAQPDALTISWHHPQNGLEIQRYTRSSLERLRSEAERLRQQAREQLMSRAGCNPTTERGELWRTLGQELDTQAGSLRSLHEEGETFVVSLIVDGRYVQCRYDWNDLRQRSQARRTGRPRPEASPAP